MTTVMSTRRVRTLPDAPPQFPEGVRIVGIQTRSTNLERDIHGPLQSPYIGARAMDVLERITSAVTDLHRTRSWSFTGPYGSGKSTLANLTFALLGHDMSRREEAERLLGETSPSLAQRLAAARDALTSTGFLGAVATARREPLVATLSRALSNAAATRWGKRIPKTIAGALADCGDPNVTQSTHILTALRALAAEQPVLLVIDEFGKTLEYLAGRSEFAGPEQDLFMLQELAEHSAGTSGLPVFLLTLQHLSFMDYASRSSELEIREWAKIQGRFEDITFVPHHGDSLQLLRRRLDHTAVTATGVSLIKTTATAAARSWKEHGLNVLAELDTSDFADLYPLHPLTAIAAPLLAAQIGQHDRSLAGFLGGSEPGTIRDALRALSAPHPERASTIRLPQLYDYFLNSGRTSLLASSNASRWIEVDVRIRDANGLPDHDQEVLKTIGVLNLIDADGALRATREMIHFALRDPDQLPDPAFFDGLTEQLNDLVDRGFLVHREFSGEFRVWQGTNYDIDATLTQITSHLDDASVIARLNQHIPSAIVAGRHSQVTGMMRVFTTTVTGPETENVTASNSRYEPADGLLIFHVGTEANRPTVDATTPVLIGTVNEPSQILAAATHVVALTELLEDKELDHVAHAEATDRLLQAEAELRDIFQTAFYPPASQATWTLWHTRTSRDSNPAELPALSARSLSALVSQACDVVYCKTPHIRNEMLGRHQLTSQAARARSDLLDAMLTRSDQQHLGFTTAKYGPERAMYHGALAYLGLHRQNGPVQAEHTSDSLIPYGFSPPTDDEEHAKPVWEALQRAFEAATARTSMEQIVEMLTRAPFGLKAGIWPLLVVTALIIRRHDVALFEEGSYVPRLTEDVVDRLVKVPGRFEVKYTPVGSGKRASVIKKLTAVLHAQPLKSQALRNPNLLSVARALIERVAVLNRYGRTTTRISADAAAVRAALLRSQDPDELLFHTLPTALGLEHIPNGTTSGTANANVYVDRLTAAVDEIVNIANNLRREVVAVLADGFKLPDDLHEFRLALAARVRGFTGVALTPDLKGFVDFALNESLSDEDWLDPIVVRLSGSALGDWTDHDASGFPRRVRDMTAALDRVAHLHRSGPTTDGEEYDLEAHLLTLTDRAGAEQRTLIYMPSKMAPKATNLAGEVLEQAQRELGPDGARILLAALTQQVTKNDADRKE